MDKPKYSVIVPVYNRVAEVKDLTDSLLAQTVKNFELVLVEDGSTDTCGHIAGDARGKGLAISYFWKENEGRSIARNYGMERAVGEYFVFFDSDCVIPPAILKHSTRSLQLILLTVSVARTQPTNRLPTRRKL